MSSAQEVRGGSPEQWPDLRTEGVLAAPRVQTSCTRWGCVRGEGTRVPHGQSE